MWQAETFAPDVITEELKWAKSLGFNSLRIFLHDLVWQQDSKKFLRRIDKVLSIAAKHGLGAMMVFFDSVWHPFPWLGKQRDPEPGVHNSGWAQSPGLAVLRDEKQFDRLQDYVVGVVKEFADDPRVQVWDVWNEPDNSNAMSYSVRDAGAEKPDLAAKYLPRVFEWVRSAKPSQPLTSGVWMGNWASDDTLKPHERAQLENSDVISFHTYDQPAEVENRIRALSRFGRPLLCTEYMSRGSGSTFEAILPILKKHNVAAYNWGFVAGKTQTNYPWDSWQSPYRTEPDPWFHEIFRGDGTPYRQDEVELIRSLTGARAGVSSKKAGDARASRPKPKSKRGPR
jgi:hypothetical protein